MIIEWINSIFKSKLYKFALLCSLTIIPLIVSFFIDDTIKICLISFGLFLIFVLVHQNLNYKKNFSEDSDGVLRCPKCNGSQWIDGPGGGSFGNIECGNNKCGTKYNNMGIFGLQEIKNSYD